jgi:hypothetical protein
MVTKEIRDQLNQMWTASLSLQEAIVTALAAEGPVLTWEFRQPIGHAIEALMAEHKALVLVDTTTALAFSSDQRQPSKEPTNG